MDPEWCPTLLRPVAAPDHKVLAFVSPSHDLVIVEAHSGRQRVVGQISKSVRQCLTDLNLIRWGPEAVLDNNASATWTRWILLATTTRLIALSIADSTASSSEAGEISAVTVADYQFENYLGRITLAEWAASQKHAVVVFETATQVSIVSTVKPERTDLALPKFVSYQGFAENPAKTCFAIILRSKGQDQVAVFATAGDDEKFDPIIFSPGTVDAQGLAFSPNNDPVLAIWDSATYGPRVVFFTAMGHPLKQLEVSEQNICLEPSVHGGSSMGISRLAWTRSRIHGTLLVIGDCDGAVHIQGRNNRDMTIHNVASLVHSDTIDAAQIPVWQETVDQTFNQPAVALNLQFDPKSTFDDLQPNADTTFIATKLTNLPRAVWIWDVRYRTIVTVITLQHDVKQLLWHPTRHEILVLITTSKQSNIVCWHNARLPPQTVRVASPPNTIATATRWKGEWLKPAAAGGRCPFLLSSTKQFILGFLALDGEQIVFQSVSDTVVPLVGADDEVTELIDTPSKPGRGRGAATSTESDMHVDWAVDMDHLW